MGTMNIDNMIFMGVLSRRFPQTRSVRVQRLGCASIRFKTKVAQLKVPPQFDIFARLISNSFCVKSNLVSTTTC